MKTNVQTTRRGFTLVELLVVIVIIASLAGLTAPMVIRQRKKADQTEAVSNAKQIGLALFEFDTEFGTYPGKSSQDVMDAPGSAYVDAKIKGKATGTSNDLFKQLFQAGMTESEQMFYAKIDGTTKPDGNISADAEALKKGECGFAYIMDGANGMSTAGNPARAVAVTPFVSGENFDGDPFDKKAVILRIDNSVTSANIAVESGSTTNAGKASVGGDSLLSPTNEIWGGTTPTVLDIFK